MASIIDQIIHTVPITDALERYAGANLSQVNIKRKQFLICCPFHDDRHPSFSVYTETNTFFCWAGCNTGKAGNVINLLMLSRNISTKEAIKILVSDYSIGKADSEQVEKWLKERADREQAVALQKRLSERIFYCIDRLREIQKEAELALFNIKTIEDLDEVGVLYHLQSQIDYWLLCFAEDDPIIDFLTIEEVSEFLEESN